MDGLRRHRRDESEEAQTLQLRCGKKGRDTGRTLFLELCGMFLAFLSELKKTFILFMQRKQELSGDRGILGTGEEV